MVWPLIPAVLAVVLYWNTAEHGYVLDDVSAITKNMVVKQGQESLGTIFETHYRYGYWDQKGSLYRPMALALFAMEWEYWPNDPGKAHVVNIVLYGIFK